MNFIEGQTVELKREVVDEIRKTVIAFANSEGGTIYVGVLDNGEICGVKDPDGDMLRLSNMVRDSIKPDVTMFVSYGIEEINDKNVIEVTVQKGTESPYYLTGKGLRPEGVYVRQGASSVPATESAIRKMIKETDGDAYENMRSLNQELTFETAEREFGKRDVPFGINQYKSLKIMNAEGIYSNLGLLLSDQCVHTIKAAVFEGLNKTVFRDRREFGGSLLKQLNDVYAYIEQYNRTKAEFSGLYRIDHRDYPEEALREALLNSLVHRDYSFSGSTLVSIFDNRIEFVSIGGLVKGISLNDILLGVSITRNEKLANIFYRLMLIEAYGTGVPKILRSYDKYPQKPQFEVSDNAFKIILPNTNMGNEKNSLTDQEQAVYDLIKDRNEIIRKDVEEKLHISQTMSGRILKQMLVKDVIQSVGKGKITKYVLK